MRGVLITGGSGYLGRHLARRLMASERYDRICIYSRGEHAQAAMRAELNDQTNRMRWFIGDVRDQDRLERAMEECELVIHAAALKRIELANYCPDELIKTNVLGSMAVVEAAARRRVGDRSVHPRKVLLVSSDKACQPVSAYGQTKALAESLFLAANNVYPRGARYAVVRYGNVWCSTGSVVPTWRAAIEAGQKVSVTDVNCTRFYMTIREAANLVLNTADTMQGGELVIPALPAYKLGDLLSAMRVVYFEKTGLPSHEKLHESMDDTQCSAIARRMSVRELEEALNAS